MSSIRRNSRYAGIVVGLVASAVLLSSCAHIKKPARRAEVGLVYKWEVGKPLRYEMKSHTEQNMEMMGQGITNKSDSYIQFTLEPKKVNPDGSAEVVFRLDSISAQIQSPMGNMNPDLKSLTGKEAVFLLSSTGKVLRTISGAENFEYQIAQGMKTNMSQNFSRVLARVPGRPVQIGEKWVIRDTTTTTQSGLDIQVVVSRNEQAVAKELVAKIPCLKVHGEGEMSMDGSGQNPMAGQMSFEGDGRLTGDYWFDTAHGRLVKNQAKFELEATVAIAGQQNMTMPMESVTTLTATLLTEK